MALFQRGDFTLHSGERSSFLINCTALTQDDLAALAALAASRLGPFGPVLGVPRGGLRFAAALRAHARADSTVTLLADDVYTTGASLAAVRAQHPAAIGVVLFARRPPPPWITPLFVMAGAYDTGTG